MLIVKSRRATTVKPKSNQVVSDLDGVEDSGAMQPPLPTGYQVKSLNAAHNLMSEADINRFLTSLGASIDSMKPEMAFIQCRTWFDRPYFEQVEDRRLKASIANLLYQRFKDRMPLWAAIYHRDPSVLDLI